MSKKQYRCKVCNGQDLTLRSTSNWNYATQRFSLNEIDPEYDAYCHDCGEYVDWDMSAGKSGLTNWSTYVTS
jgi:hypothetical protein